MILSKSKISKSLGKDTIMPLMRLGMNETIKFVRSESLWLDNFNPRALIDSIVSTRQQSPERCLSGKGTTHDEDGVTDLESINKLRNLSDEGSIEEVCVVDDFLLLRRGKNTRRRRVEICGVCRF